MASNIGISTLAVLLITAFLASSCDDQDDYVVMSSNPVSCSDSNNNISLETYVNYQSDIFIGRVIEVRAKYNPNDDRSNRCWALLEITNSLKGQSQGTVWVESYFPAYTNKDGYVDMKDSRNCVMQEGKSYLIFGSRRTAKSKTSLRPATHLMHEYDKNADCPPFLLEEDSSDMLTKIKQILGSR